MIRIEDFDYPFEESMIAQTPANPRDSAKLLVVCRTSGTLADKHFYDLPDYLGKNDVLVVNETKVIPARLTGKKSTGGKVEVLLIKQLSPTRWLCLSKPGLKAGNDLEFAKDTRAVVVEKISQTGEVAIEFKWRPEEFMERLMTIGHTPIPPYIQTSLNEDALRQEYQTVYAKDFGSAAAPTAGMHFTFKLLERLASQKVQIEKVTLHVGPGTFQRLRQENLVSGKLHHEDFWIDPAMAARLFKAKKAGKRIVSVGTTTTRALESAFISDEVGWRTGPQVTDLFIRPGYKFKAVDSLITNFHLPKSSLLMLVTAFASAPNSDRQYRDFRTSLMYSAYCHAIEEEYRFFSFGDAMLILD